MEGCWFSDARGSPAQGMRKARDQGLPRGCSECPVTTQLGVSPDLSVVLQAPAGTGLFWTAGHGSRLDSREFCPRAGAAPAAHLPSEDLLRCRRSAFPPISERDPHPTTTITPSAECSVCGSLVHQRKPWDQAACLAGPLSLHHWEAGQPLPRRPRWQSCFLVPTLPVLTTPPTPTGPCAPWLCLKYFLQPHLMIL